MARILVVDDELSMREFLEILLRKRDHEVITAASLPAALKVAAEGDLVVELRRMYAIRSYYGPRRVQTAAPRMYSLLLVSPIAGKGSPDNWSKSTFSRANSSARSSY